MQNLGYESESSEGEDEQVMVKQSMDVVDLLASKGKINEWSYNLLAKSLKLAYKSKDEESDDSFINDESESESDTESESEDEKNIKIENVYITIQDKRASILMPAIIAISILAMVVAFY